MAAEGLLTVDELLEIPDDLDLYAAEYIAAAFKRDRTKGRVVASHLPYALQAVLPTTTKFPLAVAAGKGWHKVVPSKKYPPMSQELMAVVALRMALVGQWRSAVQTVSFHCLNA